MAWSAEDARKAMEIAKRYPLQAAKLLGLGAEAKEKGIEAALRDDRVRLRDETTDRQEPYNYACLSPGGKQVHFWRLAWVDDLAGLAGLLREAARRPHGVRRNRLKADGRADITLNGQRRRADRIEIDFNGTTRPHVLEAARRHGFVLEPAIEAPMDEEVDGLRRHERAAWIHRGVREGRKGTWAVFDLARKHEPFSRDVKELLRGRFACLEHDDWNWYVDLDASTVLDVARLAKRHQVAISRELREAILAAISEARGRPAGV